MKKYIILLIASIFLVSCGFEKTQIENTDTSSTVSPTEQEVIDDFKDDLSSLIGVEDSTESELPE